MENKPNKLKVLWVDHDPDITKLLEKISQKRNLENLVPVSNHCEFDSLVVDYVPPAEDKTTLLEKRIEREIRKVKKGGSDAIMIDLSFGPHADPGEVKVGFGIAKYLQQAFHPSAVGVYTRSLLSPAQKAVICSGGIDLVLEDIGNLIDYTPAMTADSWTTLFKDAVERAKNRATRFPTFDSADDPDLLIEWSLGHPKSTSPAFQKYAPRLVAMALAHISNLKGVKLSQLGGGFSGSYLVKAEPQGGQKMFVVKIDESPKRLLQEYEGYRQFGAYLSQRNFIKPEGEPVALSADLWGAFAMEYDGKRKPLIECEPLQAAEFVKIYTAIWSECLFNPYGRIETKQLGSSAIVKDGSRIAAYSSIQGWQRYLDRVRRANAGILAWVDKGVQWLGATGGTTTDTNRIKP